MFKTIAKGIGGLFKSDVVEKTLDLAEKHVVDQDKRNELIGGLLTKVVEQSGKPTIPLIDGLHKLGRQLLSVFIAWVVYDCHVRGVPLTVEQMAFIAGPALGYNILKGKGR